MVHPNPPIPSRNKNAEEIEKKGVSGCNATLTGNSSQIPAQKPMSNLERKSLFGCLLFLDFAIFSGRVVEWRLPRKKARIEPARTQSSLRVPAVGRQHLRRNRNRALASSRSKILDWAEAPLFHVRNRLLPAIENTAYQIKETTMRRSQAIYREKKLVRG
jgi:hypothetical protein